jgi:hypothetical protein
MIVQARKQGLHRNKMLRYKLILDLYNQYKTDDIPVTVVLRKYIYPRYPISRTTLYTVLSTPVDKSLKEMDVTPYQPQKKQERQYKLFD